MIMFDDFFVLFIQLFDVIVTDVIVTITNGDLANVIAMFVMAEKWQ